MRHQLRSPTTNTRCRPTNHTRLIPTALSCHSSLFCIAPNWPERQPRCIMPYSVGLQTAGVALLSAGFPTLFTTAIVVLLVIIAILSSLHKTDSSDSVPRLPTHSLFAIFPFFRRRHDFLNWGFGVTGQSAFQFDLLRVCLFVYGLASCSLTDPVAEQRYRGIRRARPSRVLLSQRA